VANTLAYYDNEKSLVTEDPAMKNLHLQNVFKTKKNIETLTNTLAY
jgi:hypothetical protein